MYQLDPQPAKKKSGCLGKILKGSLIVIGLFIALVIVVGIMAPKSPASQTRTNAVPTWTATGAPMAQKVSATPTLPPASTAAPSIGQDVLVDEVRWKILSAENLGNKLTDDNQFTDDVTTSGKFIKVRFEVENRSKEMLSFAGLDLVDDKGRKYTRSSGADLAIPREERCFIENINPSITKVCSQIYEVPSDAAGLQADAGDLKMLGDAHVMITLGQ